MRSMIAVAALALALAACDGSAEKTGEKMDNAVEDATQGHRDLSDGPMERAGETVDQATGTTRSGDVADSVNDATDNNSQTRP